MLLLNPKNHTRPYPDRQSLEAIQKTIEFFESKGKTRLKAAHKVPVSIHRTVLDHFVSETRCRNLSSRPFGVACPTLPFWGAESHTLFWV